MTQRMREREFMSTLLTVGRMSSQITWSSPAEEELELGKRQAIPFY
jgi:hypothetical protein